MARHPGDEAFRVLTTRSPYGNHRGELFGIPATGKDIRVTGIAIWRIRDDRIVEHWHETEQMGLTQQLGVLPPASQVGNAAVLPEQDQSDRVVTRSRPSSPISATRPFRERVGTAPSARRLGRLPLPRGAPAEFDLGCLVGTGMVKRRPRRLWVS